jgi:hypothetical protein
VILRKIIAVFIVFAGSIISLVTITSIKELSGQFGLVFIVIMGLFFGLLPIFIGYKIFKSKRVINLKFSNAKRKQSKLTATKEINKNNFNKSVLNVDVKPDYHIVYVDNAERETQRAIHVNECHLSGKTIYLECYCFLAKDERTFKVGNIKMLTDMNTGELIHDPDEYFRNKYDL